MKKTYFYLLCIMAMLIWVSGCGLSGKLPVDERQKIIRDMEEKTLQRLYTEKVSTKEEIKKAAGYGTFSNANINIIFTVIP